MVERQANLHRPWIIDGARLHTRRRLGGGIGDLGHDYQRAYALARLADMLRPDSDIVALRYEGAQDVDLWYRDGRQEHVQLKSGLSERVTVAGLRSVFQSFALDLAHAMADQPPDGWCHLRFRLVVRTTAEDAAMARIRAGTATSKDKAAVAEAIAAVLAVEPSAPVPGPAAVEILTRLTVERGAGALADGAWSFELSAERALRKAGVGPARVQDAVRALKAELRPKALLERDDVWNVLRPYLTAPEGMPEMAPRVPWSYERRSVLLEGLRDRIVSLDSGRPVALHGMGGCGKTVLALAAVDDAMVRAEFPDGVLWATLGQEPDLAGHLRAFAASLGGGSLPTDTPEALSGRVRQLVGARRCLVVLDDVWRLSDAETLNVVGGGGRLVLTTRDATIAQRLAADVVEIGGMEEAEGLRLLSRRANRDLDDGELARAKNLIARLEGLPLAIELGAAQIAMGRNIRDLLEELSAEIARLETLDSDRGDSHSDDPERRRSASLEACFTLSVRRLDPFLRQSFERLGILRDDAVFGAGCARLLFEADDERRALDALRLLAARALLSRADGDTRFRLHDLLRDYARSRLAAESGSGAIARENAQFLERCRRSCTEGRWSEMPADSYLDGNLLWHALQAGKPEVVHEVLEERVASRHAWVARRLAAGEPAGLADDLTVGRTLAAADLRGGSAAGPAVRRLVRYGLLHASLRDEGTWTPAPLVVRLVEAGHWSVDRALSYARVSSFAPFKVWTMAALAERLGSRWDGPVGEEAVKAAVPGSGPTVFTEPDAEALFVTNLPQRLQRMLLETCIRRGLHFHAAALAALGRHAPENVSAADLARFQRSLGASEVTEETRIRSHVRIIAAGMPLPGGPGKILDDLERAALEPRTAYDVLWRVFPALDRDGRCRAVGMLLEVADGDAMVGFLRSHCACLDAATALMLLSYAETADTPLRRGWMLGLLVGALPEPEGARSRAEAIRLLANGDGDPFVRFKALTDVGLHIGGADGVGLETAGIEAGIQIGLGNVGTMPLREYAKMASEKGLERLLRALGDGTDWDRVRGLPGALAVVPEAHVRRLSLDLGTAMEGAGSRPDLFPCYRRFPEDLLPRLLAAAKGTYPTVAEYEALASVARVMRGNTLQTVAERARRDTRGMAAADRLAVASALAPEFTLYDGMAGIARH